MEQKKNIDGKIEDALSSLDGIRKAAPQPWLYSRVMARLEQDSKSMWERVSAFLSKPAVAMAGLGMIVVVNVFVLFQQGQVPASGVAVRGVEQSQVLDSESIIASNSSFDYENLVQP